MMLGMRIKYTGGVELVKPTAKGDKKDCMAGTYWMSYSSR